MPKNEILSLRTLGMCMSKIEQEAINAMFDRIASTYDLINRVLSWQKDQHWRSLVADLLPQNKDLTILDIATGTADLLITMCKKRANITMATGIDLSDQMLLLGQQKLVKEELTHRARLMKADACALPFADCSFDVVSIAFGIRNVVNMAVALQEISRVLKPDGLLLILEFSMPSRWWVRQFYLGYFRYLLPLIGGLISSDFAAYRYLNRSVEAFPNVDSFKQTLLNNRFKSVETRALTLGIATIYHARIG